MKLKTALLHLSVFNCALPGLFAQAIPHSFREAKPDPNWQVSVGSRFVFSGAKASFKNLGTISTQAPSLEAGVNRVYHDGYVRADEIRASEEDPNTVIKDGRYLTHEEDEDGNMVQTGDYLCYDANKSRGWSFKNAEQADGGNINLNTYSSKTNGGSVAGDQSRAGEVEVQFARMLFEISPRMRLSLMGSFSLSDIAVESNGSISADLSTITHTYSLFGVTAPSPPYSGPTFEDLVDDEDNVITPGGKETTIPISQEPIGTSNSTTAGGARVNGLWEIDGAYVSMRLGPRLHARLSKLFQVTLGAGISTHFASTHFKYQESLEIPTQSTNSIKISNKSNSSEVLVGYFAEANLESWFNERTGVFVGVHYEEVGDYEQELDGRLANISLGGSSGMRAGLIFRF